MNNASDPVSYGHVASSSSQSRKVWPLRHSYATQQIGVGRPPSEVPENSKSTNHTWGGRLSTSCPGVSAGVALFQVYDGHSEPIGILRIGFVPITRRHFNFYCRVGGFDD